MNRQQWHQSRRARHEAYRDLWNSEDAALREVVKASCVPTNVIERIRNLRWRILSRALKNPAQRSGEIASLRQMRAIA